MDSMDPCYSLLNMKLIWLHMVSASPPITIRLGEGKGDLTWKLPKFYGDKIISYICGRINIFG